MKSHISKLLIVLTCLIMLISLSACGNNPKNGDEFGHVAIDNVNFYLPDGWSNSWKDQEYSNNNTKNAAYLIVKLEDDLDYDKAVADFGKQTKKSFSDCERADLEISGQEAVKFSYIDKDEHYCSMLIIKNKKGLITFGYSSNNETSDDNEFDDIIDTIKIK